MELLEEDTYNDVLQDTTNDVVDKLFDYFSFHICH